MAEPKGQITGLTDLLDMHLEWLVIRENGRTLPFMRSEIEVKNSNGNSTLSFVDEKGLAKWRIEHVDIDEPEIVARLSSKIRNESESIRFVARESAAELRANIELARLQKANEIAEILAASEPGTKLIRVSLNVENGRIAQIESENREKIRSALMADVTASLTHESILASSMKSQDKPRMRRKNPISHVAVIAENRQARNLQKLLALLDKGASANISIFEIDRNGSGPITKELRRLKMSDLWRERAGKLKLPQSIEPTETAQKIIEMSPEKIDRIVAKNGETLRFLGMPFARVRSLMGREKAWFGRGQLGRPGER